MKVNIIESEMAEICPTMSGLLITQICRRRVVRS